MYAYLHAYAHVRDEAAVPGPRRERALERGLAYHEEVERTGEQEVWGLQHVRQDGTLPAQQRL